MSRRPILMSTYSPSRRSETRPLPGSVYNGFDPHLSVNNASVSSSRHGRSLKGTSSTSSSSKSDQHASSRPNDKLKATEPMDETLKFDRQEDLHSHSHHLSRYDQYRSPSWEEKKSDSNADYAAPSLRCTPSPPASLVNLGRKSGSRIARLSSLFGGGSSKREVVAATAAALKATRAKQQEQEEAAAKPIEVAPPAAPPSPQQSSSSGGYVGWPGTQDRRGRTVQLHSSYEESSVGQGTTFNDDSYQQEDDEGDDVLHNDVGTQWPEMMMTKPFVSVAPGVDVSFESITTINSSFSKSPARLQRDQVQIETEEEMQARRMEPRQQRRQEYSDMFDLADAIAGTSNHYSSPEFKSHPTARAELAHRQQPPRVNVRSLIQKRQAADPQGIVFAGATRSEPEPFVDFDGSRHFATQQHEGLGISATVSSGYKKTSVYSNPVDYDPYGTRERMVDSNIVLPPTREALAANERVAPPASRAFANSQKFRGLVDKTRDVPCLMDDADSESMTSSKATSTFSSSLPQTTLHIHPDPPARSVVSFERSPRRIVAFDEQEEIGAPQLLDHDDESDVFDGVSAKDSDVFDDLSHLDARSRNSLSPRRSSRSRGSYPESIAEEEEEDVQIVLLGGGLTAIQTSKKDFTDRKTASDYDDNLTNSDIDQFGFASTPAYEDMMVAGLKHSSSLLGIQSNFSSPTARRQVSGGSESGSSLFTDPYELDRPSPVTDGSSEYAIDPAHMKLLVRTYRKFSDKVNVKISLEEFEKEEDEHKAFALFEMRSRIMEKDIERGLERRGGTVVVDDLILTAYNRMAHRIRDAVIVSKAWRDGTSPKDVITSALLTGRHEHTFFIRRPSRPNGRVNDSMSSCGSFYPNSSMQYWWEPVEWMDDATFNQFRCPSLGPRHMRGVDMFTIGDCQSMLLKLTNERCAELRLELNDATRRQLEAEEQLAAEGDVGDGMMTDAEVAYLGSMEDVKTISRELVQAEQSFNLVRERIEKLVQKYEHLLSKMDTESFAGASSIMTYESSYISEHDSAYWHAMEERERAVWARRAQRAEVKAQIAAREALLLKQQARMFQEQKQRELEQLQQKLNDLQSESSFSPVDRSHTVKLAQRFAMHRHDEVDDDESMHEEQDGQSDRNNLDNVKKRFRDRMKDRMQQNSQPISAPTSVQRFGGGPEPVKRHLDPALRDLFRSAGEEMCQQLDFYERSLRAVMDEPN
ncbi:hypothetical protein MPSEU_000604600 [Mayamaea pseudoterrestris]|nr:hypothetical protein MPSEU_000604600 [Mayamaea pseudoterrestris]